MGRCHKHRSELNGSDDELTRATLALWQPHATRRLSAEDAREMATNVAGFFQLLQEWDVADRQKRRRNDYPTRVPSISSGEACPTEISSLDRLRPK